VAARRERQWLVPLAEYRLPSDMIRDSGQRHVSVFTYLTVTYFDLLGATHDRLFIFESGSGESEALDGEDTDRCQSKLYNDMPSDDSRYFDMLKSDYNMTSLLQFARPLSDDEAYLCVFA
jgi:hypothetical protein